MDSETAPHKNAVPAAPPEPPLARSRKSSGWSPGTITALLVTTILLLWLAMKALKSDAPAAVERITPTTVAVATVNREDLLRELSISAEFRPRVEVELHAKVTGYVEQMNVDFGDHVTAGQLLATLEVPELYDQLRSAQAMWVRSEADYTNAHVIYGRLQLVNKQHPNLVAQQELDTAFAKDAAAAAAIAAAGAEVEKFRTLTNYTRITAPFAGVVTRRYVDPGALIQAGTTSSSEGGPLLRVSDNFHLRLDFQVSVDHVKNIHVGDMVNVRVDSLGGKKYAGAITRFTSRVAEDTRTMTVELEIANPDLEIVPGMYAAVKLVLERHAQVLAVPIEAVGGEKNPTVYVVNGASQIESRPVTLGLETPERYEILSGLKAGDQVMIGNRSLVHPGEKVEALSQSTGKSVGE